MVKSKTMFLGVLLDFGWDEKKGMERLAVLHDFGGQTPRRHGMGKIFASSAVKRR